MVFDALKPEYKATPINGGMKKPQRARRNAKNLWIHNNLRIFEIFAGKKHHLATIPPSHQGGYAPRSMPSQPPRRGADVPSVFLNH